MNARPPGAPRRRLPELRSRLVDVVIATSADDARAVVAADPAIQCLLLNWELGNDADHAPAQAVLDAMRARNATVPVFLLASRASVRDSGRRDAQGRRLHLDAGGHHRVHRRPHRRRDRALPRNRAAADVPRTREVFARVRILVAHARPHGRHRVPEIAGRSCVLRILRRIAVPLRPVDLGRRTRLAARSLGDRRKRTLCGARVRRASHVSRDERLVDVEPRDPDGERDARSRCATATATSRPSTR